MKRRYQDPLAWQTLGVVHQVEQCQRGRHASVFHDTKTQYQCCHFLQCSDTSSSEDDSSNKDFDDSDDQIDDDDKIVLAQRVHLEKDEKNRLGRLLPLGTYVGLPFLTRFTNTNLFRYDMVCIYQTPSSFPKLISRNREKDC